jgi:hypothetical protein
MEERAGERRRILSGLPLSSILSPLVPRRERKKNVTSTKILMRLP